MHARKTFSFLFICKFQTMKVGMIAKKKSDTRQHTPSVTAAGVMFMSHVLVGRIARSKIARGGLHCSQKATSVATESAMRQLMTTQIEIFCHRTTVNRRRSNPSETFDRAMPRIEKDCPHISHLIARDASSVLRLPMG